MTSQLKRRLIIPYAATNQSCSRKLGRTPLTELSSRKELRENSLDFLSGEVIARLEQHSMRNHVHVSHNITVPLTVSGQHGTFEVDHDLLPAFQVSRLYGHRLLLHWPSATFSARQEAIDVQRLPTWDCLKQNSFQLISGAARPLGTTGTHSVTVHHLQSGNIGGLLHPSPCVP